MKILAFAATNHKDSINKKLVSYAANILKTDIAPDAEIEFIDLIDYELPLYRQDREAQDGIPKMAKEFFQKITNADALIVSFAEHNGGYTAVYKNLFDWASRIDMKVYQEKPMILMSTSPGPGGAGNVLKTANDSAGFFGMDVRATLSIPSFPKNYDSETKTITNPDLQKQIHNAITALN